MNESKIVAGSLTDTGGFDPWRLSPEESVGEIERAWAGLDEDPNIDDICWFNSADSEERL